MLKSRKRLLTVHRRLILPVIDTSRARSIVNFRKRMEKQPLQRFPRVRICSRLYRYSYHKTLAIDFARHSRRRRLSPVSLPVSPRRAAQRLFSMQTPCDTRCCYWTFRYSRRRSTCRISRRARRSSLSLCSSSQRCYTRTRIARPNLPGIRFVLVSRTNISLPPLL